jgi:hypothetical protein
MEWIKEPKVSVGFVILCYICISIWMITSNEVIFNLIIITFIMAMTLPSLNKKQEKKSK